MNILNQPAALSLSGNIEKFRIQSAESFSFVLSKGNTRLLSSVYTPGTDGYVTIDIRDIVESQLSFLMKDITTPYEQPDLAADFTAVIGDKNITFRVLRCGVDRFSGSAETFLKANFLTWQPQVKKVTYYSPEYLTYYAVISSYVKVKAYFIDDEGKVTEEVKQLATLGEKRAYTIPVQYAVIMALFESRLPSFYDVWVEDGSGSRLTYVQRYVAQVDDTLKKVETYVSIIPNWKDLLEQGTLKHYVQQFGRQWNARLQEQTEIKEALTSKSAQKDSLKKEEANAIGLYEEKKQKEERQQAELNERARLRSSLLNGESTETVVATHARRQKELEQQLEKAMNLHHSLTVQAESYKGQTAQLEKELVRLTVVLQQDELKINEWLTLQKETYAELEQLLSKDKSWILAEKQALGTLKEKETTLQAVLAERRQKREEHQQAPLKPDTTENKESLIETLTACTAAKEMETGRLAQIEVTIQNHIKGKERIAGIEKELEEKNSIYENWAKLNELFGSQTGAKFKEIAQGYTLDVLLLYANRHLQDLAPRYELQRIPDTLALQIVDLDMMGEVRSVHSLSGGESFLVSLALALGLSSLSSNRMNVESLFIDEGFGSLDMDTLRIAMDALERLQMQGRKIGVISHVAEMMERIPAQVQVVKTGSGRSKVQVMGPI